MCREVIDKLSSSFTIRKDRLCIRTKWFEATVERQVLVRVSVSSWLDLLTRI